MILPMAVGLLSVCVGIAGAGPAAAVSLPYALPSNPQAAVISYDSKGGMVPRASGTPLIAIHADGSVVGWNPDGGGRLELASLGVAGLQELLRFILLDQRFAESDGARINAEIKELAGKSGRIFSVADAGVSVIAVDIPAVHHEVEFYALDWAARLFPEIDELQRLAAVERRIKAFIPNAGPTIQP
jgi:hypothetical protein